MQTSALKVWKWLISCWKLRCSMVISLCKLDTEKTNALVLDGLLDILNVLLCCCKWIKESLILHPLIIVYFYSCNGNHDLGKITTTTASGSRGIFITNCFTGLQSCTARCTYNHTFNEKSYEPCARPHPWLFSKLVNYIKICGGRDQVFTLIASIR
jgi:hypothetical protein